ncbi:MAG: NADH-quinone oxidoreductase subunit C [Euryarchaeota archaeon]|nr:NADH-quinone oxidoreductase subunit C [Euryarchaeota archaeon]
MLPNDTTAAIERAFSWRPSEGTRSAAIEVPCPPALIASAAHRLVDGGRFRFASLVGDEVTPGGRVRLSYVFLSPGLIVTILSESQEDSPVPSIVPYVPAAEWAEREAAEMHGLSFANGLPPILLAHDGWPAGPPLKHATSTGAPKTGLDYPFSPVKGEGVYEVAVGPVHAGVIEPGHFRVSLAGETVLALEIRLGYTHRGVEKMLEGRDFAKALILAERTSGDNSAAHSTAFCHAVESALRIEAPERARFVRTVFLELERMHNHLADIGGVLLDVAYGVGASQCQILREELLRLNAEITGSRLLFGTNVVGGIAVDLDAATMAKVERDTSRVAREADTIVARSVSSGSVLDRLDQTGTLRREDAQALGVVGPSARASGVNIDSRRDWPHAAYGKLEFDVPVRTQGDVFARTQLKLEEIKQSARIIRQCASDMPDGSLRTPPPPDLEGGMGFGLAESHRGEVLHAVRLGRDGRIARCKIRDPSFMNWRALEAAVPKNNILADFPVINKSFNLSYAGNDR